MSAVKDFIADVEELYVAGYTAAEIAMLTNMPVDEVYNALEFISENQDYEQDVSEYTEWQDYDPDC